MGLTAVVCVDPTRGKIKKVVVVFPARSHNPFLILMRSCQGLCHDGGEKLPAETRSRAEGFEEIAISAHSVGVVFRGL